MTPQQWANIGDDEGAIHVLLHRIAEHVPVRLIDYLWIFPPRRVAAGDSVVFVVAAFDDDPVRRRVITAHFTIARNRKGQAFVNARFDEHGSAPGHALTRIVDGVLHRLGEDVETSPREQLIAGDVEQWNALIVELGGSLRPAPPTEANPADAPAPDALTTAAPGSSATHQNGDIESA
jgi:hypothetical protein